MQKMRIMQQRTGGNLVALNVIIQFVLRIKGRGANRINVIFKS